MGYLVSRQGVAQGPFTIEEIVQKVRGKELELFDYIYDEAKSDWVLMMEYAPIAEQLKSSKPPAPRPVAPNPTVDETQPISKIQTVTTTVTTVSKSGKSDAHAIDEWFVLKGENRFGPFAYGDVIKMMQQKVVFPFDYVWHAGLANWTRVAQIEEFNSESIRALFNKPGKNKGVFSERQHKRQPYEGKVFVHDNLTLWKGTAFEISRGGVGISMNNSVVVPGQNVTVHFKQHGDWPAFNAVCEVVSKKFVNDDSPVQYGLRFLSMTQEVQSELNKKVA